MIQLGDRKVTLERASKFKKLGEARVTVTSLSQAMQSAGLVSKSMDEVLGQAKAWVRNNSTPVAPSMVY